MPLDRCPNCRHPWNEHDRLIEGAGKRMLPEYNPYGVHDLYECIAYAGMGDNCGCRSRSRTTYVNEGPHGFPVPKENP